MSDRVRTEASAFQKPLEAALENALVYLESLDRASVAATVDLVTLRKRIGKALPNEGVPPEQGSRE